MGVDAGGDAFAMAQEVYGDPEPAGSASLSAGRAQEARSVPSVLSVLQRGEEMSRRYEKTIARQAELLGIQGERITEAIRLLANCKEPQCYAVIRILKGEDSG